jgi:hypothetical protein
MMSLVAMLFAMASLVYIVAGLIQRGEMFESSDSGPEEIVFGVPAKRIGSQSPPELSLEKRYEIGQWR